MIDVYCERTGPELLAEPLNAFSNLSFLIAAWAAWKLAKKLGKLTLEIRILIALAFSVGIGSVLWHTYPTRATLILDIAPILFFIIWYIRLYSRTVIGVRPLLAGVLILLFLAATYSAFLFAGVLHGALVYSPGLLVVLILGLDHANKRGTARWLLLSTAGIYFAALFFRTIDQEVCSPLPIGTHFIWHGLIGLVTYTAMRALIFSVHSKNSKILESPLDARDDYRV